MRHSLVFLSVLLSSGLLPAQWMPLRGPVEAFTFDAPTTSIRAVVGTLGSASLGPALLSGLDYASVAPGRDYAIGFHGGQGLLVSGLGSEEMSIIDLPASLPVPEGIVWSGDGSLAILYSRTGNWIRTLNDLPGSASPGPYISALSLPGSLSAVATDFPGKRIAIGVAGENAGVYEITGSEALLPLLSVPRPTALAFSGDGGTLYILDSATMQMFGLTLAGLAFQSWRLEGLQDPSAVSCAQDEAGRQVVYVAAHGDRVLRVYDASTHDVVASALLTFQPAAIEPLGPGSFLLRPRVDNGDPLWSFTNASEPMVYFIPATPLIEVGEDRSSEL
jgi:sugar lactone lactonase YvrE